MRFMAILSVVLLLIANCFAQQGTDWQEFMTGGKECVLAMNSAPEGEATSMTMQADPQLKSLKKSLFYSLAVPGAGQAYNGSWYKAAGFAAVEVAGWTVFAVKHSEGKDIESEFQDFANTHWSEEWYWNWISVQSGVLREDMEGLRAWEHQTFSHGLHETKDQQYYEMIGKYYQFNYGWDDFRTLVEDDITITHETMTHNKLYSSNRIHYEERRDASNKALKAATTGATVVLFNHLISAFEAALGAKRHNDRIKTVFYFEPRYLNSEPVTVLSMQMSW